jgi:hypothetical protein
VQLSPKCRSHHHHHHLCEALYTYSATLQPLPCACHPNLREAPTSGKLQPPTIGRGK